MSQTRPTTRVQGQNIGIHDTVMVSFSTYETVATVAIIGNVKRIRSYDEFTGEPITKKNGDLRYDPQFWFEDRRTGQLIGPIHRSEINVIAQIDGPWSSAAEIAHMTGDAELRDDLSDISVGVELVNQLVDMVIENIPDPSVEPYRMLIDRANDWMERQADA
jgi:hypothetical protein